jgi:hypothetical protein
MTAARPDKADAVVHQVDPISRAVVVRTLITAAAFGAFLGFVGAFNTWKLPLLLRLPYMAAMAVLTSFPSMLVYRLVCRIPWTGNRRFLQATISAAIMTPFIALAIWGSDWWLPGGGDPWSAMPRYLLNTFVVSEVITLGAVAVSRRAQIASLVQSLSQPAPPKFLERLPLKLRGAEVWAVEAEDHYLRLHTSRGQDLILLRLADAIAELEGLEGAQVHRSWWVARDAIADARRGDGRATLTLRDGSEVPVSRTYAKVLRDLGWI